MATYWHRWEAARAAGLCWGSYHYLRHGQIGAQIDNYLSFADPDPGERVAIDYEQGDCDLVDLHLAVEAILAADPSLQIAIYGGHLLKEQLGRPTTRCWRRMRCGSRTTPAADDAGLAARHLAGLVAVAVQRRPGWRLAAVDPGIAVPHDCNAFNGSAEQCRKWFGPVACRWRRCPSQRGRGAGRGDGDARRQGDA